MTTLNQKEFSNGAKRMPRLLLLVAMGGGIALSLTAVFIGATLQPRFSERTIPAPISVKSTPHQVHSAAIIVPDSGEPRTQRLAQIHAAIDRVRNTSGDTNMLAMGLISQAEVAIQLNRLGLAQEALQEVRRLMPSTGAWQSRNASFMGQTIKLLESGDAAVRQVLRDIIDGRVEALSQHAAGHYLEAVKLGRQVVAKWRRIDALRSTMPDYVEAELARDLMALGIYSAEHSDSFSESAAILAEAHHLGKRVWGDLHPIVAEVQYALARRSEDQGDFDGANSLYEQALKIFRETLTENSLPYARTLASQGRMHLDWWEEYAAGKGYRALQIREQLLGQEHLECAESLEHLGKNALWLLNFDKAEELLRRAIEIRQREQGCNHPKLAEALNWLSQVYIFRGDLALAALSLQQAIDLSKRARGHSHPILIPYLANMARIGKYDWNPTRGEREARHALRIAEQYNMHSHPMTLDARSALAELMLEEESPYGLAQLVRRNPRYIAEFTQESIRLHGLTRRHEQLPTYAGARIQLANVGYWEDYHYVSRTEAAEQLDAAFENMQHHDQDLHPAYSDYLLNRGRWHMWISNHELAYKLLEQSRDIIEQRYGLMKTEIRAGAWRALAGVAMRAGIISPDSEKLLRQTAELDELIFRKNATGQCDIDRFSMARARFFSLGCCVLNSVSGLSAEERYRHILVAKGETSQLQLSQRLFHNRPEFSQAFSAVQQARHQLKSIAFDVPSDPESYRVWREQMFAAADQKEMKERELALALRGQFPEPPAILPQDVQQHLDEKTALLDFIQFTDLTGPPGGRGRLQRTRTLSVFVIRKDRPIQYIRLGPTKDFEESIAEWLKSIQSETQDPDQTANCAQRIFNLVWKPLAQSLEECDQVLIAPDGPICFLPFAALPGKTKNSYLIEDLSLGYIPSARQWIELTDRKKLDSVHNGLLTVGDIDYRPNIRTLVSHDGAKRRGLLPDDGHWGDLPATKEECEQIIDLFIKSNGSSAVKKALSGRVTVDQLQSSVREPFRYLHFAGHGLFADWHAPPNQEDAGTFEHSEFAYATNSESIVLGRAPLLLSGLVLTTPQETAHPADAVMTAEEVSNLNLQDMELVVLSACETGLGKTAAGEGVMGLQRAFLNAGVRSVVASLWKVDDAATSLLMERFYHHLWIDKHSKWKALREAQLDLLRHPNQIHDRNQLLATRGVVTGKTKRLVSSASSSNSTAVRTNPALWSAFVLYGDGR